MVFRVQPAAEAVPLPLGEPAVRRHAAAESFPHFDWLRFALASAVAFWHAKLIPWDYAGYLAVQVFLALSGWLIGGILLRTPRAELPRFFFNRVTRIWIPYALAVALLYAVSALREPITRSWLQFLAYDVTFTHNLFAMEPDPAAAVAAMPLHGTGNHFWSIAVEEQFYLAAPLLLLFVAGGRSLGLWLALAIVMTVTGGWFGAISFGVAAAIARERFGDWHLSVRPLLAALGAALFLAMLPQGAPVHVFAPPFAIVVVLALAVQGARSRLGELAGGLSYSLYLNAWALVFAVHVGLTRFGLPDGRAAEIVAYLLAVMAAALHFQLIDRSIQRRRGDWYSPAVGQACRMAAYGLLAVGLAFGIALWGAPLYG